ncbi:MAG: hypothetical protein JWN40_3392 [Phycisphaerales bacterium]|nr:hypothetical protein [Phycisphaerales bacterium]
MPKQAKAVRPVLQRAGGPLLAKEVARRFKWAKLAVVGELLETLVSLGQARRDGERFVV